MMWQMLCIGRRQLQTSNVAVKESPEQYDARVGVSTTRSGIALKNAKILIEIQ